MEVELESSWRSLGGLVEVDDGKGKGNGASHECSEGSCRGSAPRGPRTLQPTSDCARIILYLIRGGSLREGSRARIVAWFWRSGFQN